MLGGGGGWPVSIYVIYFRNKRAKLIYFSTEGRVFLDKGSSIVVRREFYEICD